MDHVIGLSIIQSTSQTFIRLRGKDEHSRLCYTIKQNMDSVWSSIEYYFLIHYPKNVDDSFILIAERVMKDLRMDVEELQMDIRDIYGKEAYKKLCFWISENIDL